MAGIAGVALVVGGGDGTVEAVAVAEVLLTAVCYAAATVLDEARGYLHFNAASMSCVRSVLRPLGTIHDEMEGLTSPWPRHRDFGFEEAPDEDDDLTEAERRYVDALRRRLAEGIDHPGIPAHKLGNDGWIVTPTECLSASQMWADNRHKAVEALGADDAYLEAADEFVAYATEAARHGGFEVW